MQISKLHIDNFRAIRSLTLADLPSAVALAGPNGCGKSCVLDAVRLLKSAYGGYNDHEYQKWFTEFDINIQQLRNEARRVLHDPRNGLTFRAEIVLSDSEKVFIKENGQALTFELARRRQSPGGPMMGMNAILPPAQDRDQIDAARLEAREMFSGIERELDDPFVVAELKMNVSGDVDYRPSALLEAVFSTYQPDVIGIIDYHGPNRSYSREKVANVNLNVAEQANRSRQSVLYDTQNKYTNIKTEMASAYIRELLSERAGVVPDKRSSLVETLQDLFLIFFPGKKFLGPQPTADGKLLFQVKLENGTQHDIDDLSSGEKEVLLGYLRLRNSSLKNSVILLDEPELHLNPRLVSGLARFYQRNIGAALNNQLWLVTHSDTLLREAVDDPAFAVFQMQPASAVEISANQCTRISIVEQVDRAVTDLVGDLATYSPHARIVILEGGGESKTDQKLLEQLFPEFAARVTLLTGGSKARARELHALLEQTAASGKLKARFFSIVDRDFGESDSDSVTSFTWDVYHIENYLLEVEYIVRVLDQLSLNVGVTKDEITLQLQNSARDTVDELVRIQMQRYANSQLVQCIAVGIDPKGSRVVADIRTAAENSAKRIGATLDEQLAVSELQRRELEMRRSLEESLSNGTWTREMRGRNILKRFVSRMNLEVRYEVFRNLIISEMGRDGFKPQGMQAVVTAIMAA